MSEGKFQLLEPVQRELLHVLLTDRDFFVRTLPLIKPGYLEIGWHQSVVEVIQAHFQKYHETISIPILLQALKSDYGDDSRWKDISDDINRLGEPDSGATKNRDYFMAEVTQFAKAQAMKYAIMQSVDELKAGNYGQIERLVRDALLVSPDVDLGLDYFSEINERFHRDLENDKGEKFTTGFESLDKELGGGLGRKELAMIYAPPGYGKSLWLVRVAAENLKKGKKVLYFSMEMSQDRIGARFDSSLGLIPFAERFSKFSVLKNRLEEIRKLTGDNLLIKEYPTGQADLNTLRSYLVSLHNYKGWNPDLIILDYADLMQPIDGKGLELWQKQQRIYEEVRGFASETNVCIYTASQSNRMGKQVPVITDNELGDSYGKIRVVDAAWSINVSPEEHTHSVGRIFVVKHRNGKSQYLVPIRFDYPTLRLLEVSKEKYEMAMKGGADIPTIPPPPPTDESAEKKVEVPPPPAEEPKAKTNE